MRPNCLLAGNRNLRNIVASKLILDWSPEQTSGWRLSASWPGLQNLRDLTESMLMKHVECTASVLSTLKSLGVRLAVDDFGTRYFQFELFEKFPIDSLKTDQSFVHDIATDMDNAAIGSAVITIARNLRKFVMFDTVETKEQMTFLQVHGCDEAQGYYFIEPLIAAHSAVLLQTGIPPFARPTSASLTV